MFVKDRRLARFDQIGWARSTPRNPNLSVLTDDNGKKGKEEDLLKRGGIGRPVGDEFLERVAMKSEVVSPVVYRLLPHIKARGQANFLGGIVGVELRFLLRREPKELQGDGQHLLDQFGGDSMIDDLQRRAVKEQPLKLQRRQLTIEDLKEAV